MEYQQKEYQEFLDLHHRKPWVPQFRRVLIQPINQTEDGSWFGDIVYVKNESGNYDKWYVPTDAFWQWHYKTCHMTPKGPGFNLENHVAFLTPNSPSPEVLYANELTDGTLVIQTAKEFQQEAYYLENNRKQQKNTPPQPFQDPQSNHTPIDVITKLHQEQARQIEEMNHQVGTSRMIMWIIAGVIVFLIGLFIWSNMSSTDSTIQKGVSPSLSHHHSKRMSEHKIVDGTLHRISKLVNS